LLDGKRSAAAKDVDYFGEHRYGRDNMNINDYMSIRDGEMVVGPQSTLKSILKKKPDASPIMAQSKDGMPKKMDNPLLAALSNTFTDDTNCQVDKRCICLIVGEKPESNAFTISISYNIFDDHKTKKKLEARAQLYQVIVEVCPENLKSIT
jgi:hypothetical protein